MELALRALINHKCSPLVACGPINHQVAEPKLTHFAWSPEYVNGENRIFGVPINIYELTIRISLQRSATVGIDCANIL